MHEEREKWKAEQIKQRDEERKRQEDKRRQSALELEKIREEKKKKQEEERIRKEQEQMAQFHDSSKPKQTLDARGRPLNTIQRMAKDVNRNIMDIAANIEKQKQPPQTHEQWFSREEGETALKEMAAERQRIQDDLAKGDMSGSLKNQRDAERAKMRADIQKKAKQAKKAPDF